MVQITVGPKDIDRILAHLGCEIPVLFMYTTPAYAGKIRNLLKMHSDKGPYFDPGSTGGSHSVIKKVAISRGKVGKFQTGRSTHTCTNECKYHCSCGAQETDPGVASTGGAANPRETVPEYLQSHAAGACCFNCLESDDGSLIRVHTHP